MSNGRALVLEYITTNCILFATMMIDWLQEADSSTLTDWLPTAGTSRPRSSSPSRRPARAPRSSPRAASACFFLGLLQPLLLLPPPPPLLLLLLLLLELLLLLLLVVVVLLELLLLLMLLGCCCCRRLAGWLGWAFPNSFIHSSFIHSFIQCLVTHYFLLLPRYPLYRRGINDPNDFANAVKLLKRDIYQLLLAAGIPPPYGRHVNADGAGILANLSYLMKHVFR